MKTLVKLGSGLALLLAAGCEPVGIASVKSLIGKAWRAQQVTENTTVVYTAGSATNIRQGYVNFRLNLSRPDSVILVDVDGRTTRGTWTVSTDGQRLILTNLVPKPSSTDGIIEFYILTEPTESTLSLKRTAESRKTGNSVNEYSLVPLN